MTGTWVLVCGPSGAGKDSVIGWAQARLAGRSDIVFAQRMVTRPTALDAHHQEVDPTQMNRLLRHGGLAWHWQAHGLSYGIAARYRQQEAWGRVVVVNGSREHVNTLAPDPALRIVQVTAGAAELAGRLAQRGRDSAQAVAQRLQRNQRLGGVQAHLLIRNDGELAVAGRQLTRFLTGLSGGGKLTA